MVQFAITGDRQVIAELTKIESRASKEVERAAKRAATSLKEDLNEGFASSTHFKGAAGSVTYDEKTRLGSISYEIGPDKSRRGGALGNIAFFGTSRGGRTVDLDGPVRANAEKFRREVELLTFGLTK